MILDEPDRYVILDISKLPSDLVNEVTRYDNLIASNSKNTLELTNARNKIEILLKKHPGLYPLYITQGNKPLINMLKTDDINIPQFISHLNEIKNSNPELFRKLLINPIFIDFNVKCPSAQYNIFMIAVSTGNTDLVKAILDLIDDSQLKKDILLQSLQHEDKDKRLQHKPLFDIALESESSTLIQYLMSTMDQLDILQEAAKTYETGNNNFLQKAIQLNNKELVKIIFSFEKQLGVRRVYTVFADKNHPDYIMFPPSKSGFLPTFISAITKQSPDIFNMVFNATLKIYDLNNHDDWPIFNYKMLAALKSMGIINLTLYSQRANNNLVFGFHS